VLIAANTEIVESEPLSRELSELGLFGPIKAPLERKSARSVRPTRAVRGSQSWKISYFPSLWNVRITAMPL
jgi:hypothetical protein